MPYITTLFKSMIGSIFLFNNTSKEIISNCIFTNCSQLWHLSSIPIKCNLPERLHNISVFKMCEVFVKAPTPLPLKFPYSVKMGPAWFKQTHQVVIAPTNPIYTKIQWPIAEKFHWFNSQWISQNSLKVWGTVWFEVS